MIIDQVIIAFFRAADTCLLVLIALMVLGILVSAPFMMLRSAMSGVNLKLPESWNRKRRPFTEDPQFIELADDYARYLATSPRVWVCDAKPRRRL